MKDFKHLKYETAKPLIEEGDVLLFRSNHWYSFFIKRVSQSLYSHAALASWHSDNGDKGILEIIEFHLFSGGATKNLQNMVEQYPKIIDVYRPSPVRYDLEYCQDNGVLVNEHKYDGKAVTNTMRKLTALPYSLLKIGILAKGYSFGLRLLNNVKAISDDTLKRSFSYVCSTSVAHSMNANGYDLVKNLADGKTKPGDLASSSSLNYLFTLE